MKNYFSTFLVLTILSVASSCSSGQVKQDNYKLAPVEFSNKIKELDSITLIDVRTPEEYSKGHLKNATNINWNGDNFANKISPLDKSQPVFLYCLSGGRSSSAAFKMRAMGFSKVYELDGGIIKWRNAGLPETIETSDKPIGMTMEQFNLLLTSEKLVLVDFYAPWCAPCKKMKPELDELGEQMKDKLVILRIDADEHQALFKQLKLETVPAVLLYKNKNLEWSHAGYIGKDEIVKHLK